MNIRADAAKIIEKVISKKGFLDEILGVYLTKYDSAKDRSLLQELTYGTIRWYHKLSFIVNLLQHKKNNKTDKLIYALILSGIYQIIYLRIPEYAIISETVNATRTMSKPWASAFVNATLRNFIRQKESILKQIEENQAAKYSHPNWLINILQKTQPKYFEQILLANNEYPPMHLRVNLTKITREEYLKKLNETGIKAKPINDPHLSAAITLDKPHNVANIFGFSEGLVSIQDLAAQYTISLLELKPDLRVLDACAAPGSKTTHILESQPKLQKLIAIDIANKRTKMIETALKRLNLSAKIICKDAIKTHSWWDQIKFDRILLDAPCSGTGVIRRHPDIKILRNPSEIKKNTSYQLALLEALWPLLADNGLLVYATCSILPQENYLVIKEFLEKNQTAKEKIIKQDIGVKVMHGRQLFPTKNGNDGFYYAVITKKT